MVCDYFLGVIALINKYYLEKHCEYVGFINKDKTFEK